MSMRDSKSAGNGKTTFISTIKTNLVGHRILTILDSVSVNAFSHELINLSHILDSFHACVFSVSLHISFLLPKHKPPYFSAAEFSIYFQYEDC